MRESEDLVTRAAGGDREALAALLERDLPRLRAFVRLHMGPELRAKESASDLVQSACRDVLEHLDRFHHGSETGFRHWLYTTALRIVQNKARHYRAAKRDAAREQTPTAASDATLAECYRTLTTPSRELMRREQIEIFESAMEALPAHYREVIVLVRLVGMSAAEAGTCLGRTEEGTRSLLRRALVELAEAMSRHR